MIRRRFKRRWTISIVKGGGTLLFPTGIYVVKSVNIRENIIYQGENATIIRPDKQGKWTRTFTTQNYAYSGDEDSKPLIIRNLNFDGNSKHQGNYKKFELEQAHMIFLMAKPNKPGRLKAIIEGCRFKNGVGDAISVYLNVDVEVRNCEAENVFRGGFVLTGGYSKAYLKNFPTRGKIDETGIHTEIDDPGYGRNYGINVILEDVNLLDGRCDLGFYR